MNEFKRFHPLVNMVYFVFAIGFSCVLLNPFCLIFSLIGSIAFMLMCDSKGKKQIVYFVPVFIFAALFNPLFNHRGLTIITYFPGGNPLTEESIVYGLASGAMLVAVIAWFSCFNMVMTSDKFIYLFGKVAPSLSLILSMTLRFVPRFISELKKVAVAQKGIGNGIGNGSIKDRIKNGLSVLSVTVTWALENAVETSDSMKARGYGLPGRSAFSLFKFTKKDALALMSVLFFGIYSLVGGFLGKISFEYFPTYKMAPLTTYSISVYASDLIFILLPAIIELTEVIKWNALKSKI